MAVFIDIPGIGNIEAKNAASEATLLEILRALKSTRTIPPAAGGSGALNPLNSLTKTTGLAAKSLGKMAGAVGFATGALVSLGEGTVKVVQSIANVGDSIENAANVFSGLPLLGTLFGAVASASQKVNDSYLQAAAGGASFAGSMAQFSAAATAAGMTMDKFGQFVSQNGQAMLGLGSTVEEGAKRFGQVSKGLRSVSADLYALGFSTQEINQGLANYTRNLRLAGRQGTQNNSELIAGSKKYLREMDLLAKITGETRAEKEKEREQLQLDGQFRAAMAGLAPDVEDSVMTMIQSMPTKELQNLAKDVIATGSVTRSENMALAAQLPGLVTQLQSMHQQTQANIAVGKDQLAQTLSITKADGQASMARNKSAFAASEELAVVSAAVASASRINTDAVKKASKEQDVASKSTDKMNQQLQEAQQRLAAISNEFTMYLANSGILQVMLDAFTGLVDFVRSYVVPVFKFLTNSVQTVWQILTNSLGPAFLTLKNFVIEVGSTLFEFGKFLWSATAPMRELTVTLSQHLMPTFIKAYDLVSDGFRAVSDVAQDILRPAFDFLGRITNGITNLIKTDFDGALRGVSNFMNNAFIQPFVKVANYVNEKVVPIFEPLVRIFTEMKDKFVRILAGFNSFSDIAESVKLRFQSMQISLQKLALWVDETTDLWKTDEEKADYDRRRQEIANLEKSNIEARAALDSRLDAQATQNLQAQKQEQMRIDKERQDRDNKIAYERAVRDKKIAEIQINNGKVSTNTATDLATAAKTLGKVTEQTSNYNDSVALAKIEYSRNNNLATPSSENTRAALSNKPTEGETSSQQTSNTGNTNTSANSAPRDLTETLLSNLNTKMDQLIQINRQVYTVNERQLTVQQSMTGDLFVAT